MNIQEKIKGIWGKTKDFFKNMKKSVRMALIGGAVALVLLVAGIVIFNFTRPYAVLFTELNQEDMASVVTYLGTAGITDYKIEGNETILVPAAQESTIRAGILMSGSYPASGFGYGTYLNNTGTLSSESDRLRLDRYELQDRLGATIELLRGVKFAAVNIAEEEDNRWLLDTSDLKQASASVTVTMQEGSSMTSEMAATIRTLMANAVQGLSIDNVSVIDATTLKSWSGTAELNAGDATQLMLSLQTQVSETIRNKLLDALGPLYGPENLAISVSCAVDVSKTYEESITYSFPEESAWNSLGGHGLIGEYVWNNNLLRTGGEGAGGVVGTSTNADLNEYVINEALQDPNNQELGSSGTIKYDNDKKTVQKENAGGVVTDIMVSIGINSLAIEATNIGEDLVDYVARAAGVATGVEEDKVAIVLRPFHDDPSLQPPQPTEPEELVPGWMVYALIMGVILFLVLLVCILVLRRRAKLHKLELRERAQEEAAAQAAAQLAALGEQMAAEGEGAQIMDIHSEKSMELRQNVREFVESNPEIAAQMLKSWLRGDEEHG